MDSAHHLSIHIIGDAFADIYCYLEDGLPRSGGDARLTQPVHTVPGGSGLNTATHLSSLLSHFWDAEGGDDRLASGVTLQTVINENDDYGKMIASHCRQHNIALVNRRVSEFPACYLGTEEALQCRKGDKSTGHCAVVVSRGERSFMTHLGCVGDFSGSHILTNFLTEPKSDATQFIHHHVHIAGYYNLAGFWDGELGRKLEEMRNIQRTAKRRATFSLVPQHDATEKWDGGLLDVLKHIDFLILSEVEAKGITKYSTDDKERDGDSKFIRHLKSFSSNHPSTCLVVTRGAKGACAYYDGNAMHDQSTSAEIDDPADPTGAGDAFAAGFLHGYLRHVAENEGGPPVAKDAVKAGMRWGCATGTCGVMVRGASVPSEKRTIEQTLTTIVERDSNRSDGTKRRRVGFSP